MTRAPADLSRRTGLCEGLGDAPMRPALAGGDGARPRRCAGGRGRGAGRRPRRMAFLYVPNGVHMADWTPEGRGRRTSSCPPPSSRSTPFKDDLSS